MWRAGFGLLGVGNRVALPGAALLNHWFGEGAWVNRFFAKLWLCVAPMVLSVLDTALTLWGQPREYWAGDYTKCSEENPVLRWCLEQHPAAAAGRGRAEIETGS